MALLRRALLAVAFAAMTLPAAPSTAVALGERVPQPILLSDSSLTWVEGQARWVSLSWTAQADIQDVTVTVRPSTDDVVIQYENPKLGLAELSDGAELSANEVDATTFFLDPGRTAGRRFELELVVDWRFRGEAHTGTQTLRVDQRLAGEDPFLLITTGARVPAGGDGTRNWVSLSFLGLQRGIGDFSVSIEGELPIYYPQRSFTSLHHDAVLVEDERDVARFWLDPSTIEPGDYPLDVVVSYTIDGGASQQFRSPIRVIVG